jgi:kinesin family member 2/24
VLSSKSPKMYLAKKQNKVVTPGREGKERKTTRQAIEELRLNRENRRKSAGEYKIARAKDEKRFEEQGEPGDVDFQRMIENFRKNTKLKKRSHRVNEEETMRVCVRKRPIIPRETRNRDWDTVSGINPLVIIHKSMKKVCGITKYLDNTEFSFDHVFDESEDNSVVYQATTKPLVKHLLTKGGNATIFAYGQTGSGKTYTMVSMQNRAAHDIFKYVEQEKQTNVRIKCSFFEIYGGRCIDLLNNRSRLTIREDAKGNVVVGGLEETPITTKADLLQCIERGNACRATSATEMNTASSRSHAICRITLNFPDKRGEGRFSLIDLAGSERGVDTKNHNRQRRTEGAEINKSLLALKECIRAFSNAKSARVHVPYRASKLTMVLKDSFAPTARTVMICNIAPTASSSEHTLNTLRYADRVKQKEVVHYFQGTMLPGGIEGKNEYDLPTSPNSSLDESGDTASVGSPPLSPVGRGLRQANILAKEGKISEFEKAQMKEELIKANGGRAKNASPRGVRGGKDCAAVRMPPVPGRQFAANGRRSRISPPSNISKATGTPDPKKGYEGKTGEAQRVARPPANGGVRAGEPIHRNNSRNVSKAVNSGRKAKMVENSSPRPSRIAKPKKVESSSRVDDDLHILHRSLRAQGEGESSDQLEHLHEAISQLVEEEENLLQSHMECIQVNAELLTEEGNLLAKVHGEDVVDYDIDMYAERLDDILERKISMYTNLQKNLKKFRSHLAEEEELSAKLEAEL